MVKAPFDGGMVTEGGPWTSLAAQGPFDPIRVCKEPWVRNRTFRSYPVCPCGYPVLADLEDNTRWIRAVNTRTLIGMSDPAPPFHDSAAGANQTPDDMPLGADALALMLLRDAHDLCMFCGAHPSVHPPKGQHVVNLAGLHLLRSFHRGDVNPTQGQ